MSQPVTPDVLLRAYACGLFPMAEDETSRELFWVDPQQRGILPLDGLHISRSLRQKVRKDVFTVTINRCFERVIDACAQSRPGRESTWINQEIRELYTRLHAMGAAHSVEAWYHGELAGGLYGVDLAGAFFGESMFHRRTDASKVALVHLVARLRAGGYLLLDCQFVTTHLASLGVISINRQDYHNKLRQALAVKGHFEALESPASGVKVLQLVTQTS